MNRKILFLTLLFTTLLNVNYSFCRKPRSDKGGHHNTHHNTITHNEPYSNNIGGLVVIVVLISTYFVYSFHKNKLRTKQLKNKYSSEIAENLINKKVFVGMTEEMLIDSLGKPTKVQIEHLKTKTKKILFYGSRGRMSSYVFVGDVLQSFKLK